jgi:integrase
MRVLDDIGVWKVLDAAKQTEYYSLFYFFLYTGCRRSEVLALRWQDLDLTRSQAFITRSLHQLRDGSIVYRQPKTARSRRMIVLPPSLTLVLKDHRETQEAIKETLGLNLSDQDLVFCHVEGSPYLPDTITHVWLKLTRKVGLQGIRLHDARHTHATLMLRQGVHPKIVQERLGHASIQHTLDVYSHVTDGLQAAAALKFDQVLEVRQELERQAAT